MYADIIGDKIYVTILQLYKTGKIRRGVLKVYLNYLRKQYKNLSYSGPGFKYYIDCFVLATFSKKKRKKRND